MESHVPVILSKCKIFFVKGVNILLEQPVYKLMTTVTCRNNDDKKNESACFIHKVRYHIVGLMKKYQNISSTQIFNAGLAHKGDP